MKTTICYALFFVAVAAKAEVVIVQDSTKESSDEYMAKVIAKSMIVDHMPRLVSRNVCEKVIERVHIDKHENVIRITPNNMVKCRVMHNEEILQVVRGYQVTYEYKGKLVTMNMNYDPGEYVKVKN